MISHFCSVCGESVEEICAAHPNALVDSLRGPASREEDDELAWCQLRPGRIKILTSVIWELRQAGRVVETADLPVGYVLDVPRRVNQYHEWIGWGGGRAFRALPSRP